MKTFKGILGSKAPQQAKEIAITFRKKDVEIQIKAKPGDNLMDVANSLVNEGVNVFGLCDKQLACTTCSVHVLKNYEKLKPPTEEELDILFTLPEYHYKQTRMSCQIHLTEDMDGMVIKVPEKIAEWKMDELNK